MPSSSFSSNYTRLTDQNIHDATELWYTDRDIALKEYGPIEEWDVSEVTNMHDLFGGMVNFNDDISKWDVSGVTVMKGMFNDASSFNQDIGQWDVSKVVNMRGIFNDVVFFN
jgi:surface protein